MYDVDKINLGDQIRKCRKDKNISVGVLADRIAKSANAIYKYETYDVIPDVATLLDICNALDIKIEELLNFDMVEEEEKKLNSVFNSDKLFLYYISNNAIVCSIIEMSKNRVLLYNGIKKESLKEECAYKYDGNVKTNLEKAIFHFEIIDSIANVYDEVNINVDLKFTESNIYLGSLTGINLDNKEFVKKCMIVNAELTKEELEKYMYKLKISESEIDDIKKKGYWEIQIRQMNDFYIK